MKSKLIPFASICVVFIIIGFALKSYHEKPAITDQQVKKLSQSVDNYFQYKRQEAQRKRQAESPQANQQANNSSQSQPPKQEKLEEFIQFNLTKQWKKLEVSGGMASGALELTSDGKTYEVAVLRLPSNVPLETVLGIWKQRLGIKSEQNNDYEKLVNDASQEWQLTRLSGEQKNLLIAFHKGKTLYTFFRLSNDGKISESAEKDFLELLKSSKVIKS